MLLAEMNWPQLLLGLVIVGVCFFLVVVILLQRGRGGGLAGAFGGGGGSGTFGAKTGDVFTWITVGFAGVFLLLAIFANFVFDRSELAAAPIIEAPDPSTVTLPLEDGQNPEGMKIEMITEDGQIIPTDVNLKVREEPAKSPDAAGEQPQTPQNQPPPSEPGTQTPPPSDQPSEEPNSADQDNDNGAEEQKEPGR